MENLTCKSGEMLATETNLPTSAAGNEAQIHPHVLLVHWEIHSRKGQWLSAYEVARYLVAALPGEPIGWIYGSFALQKLGRLHEARQLLLAGARRFPADWRIAYNLACYLCQLGDLAGAWNWLDRATELGEADTVKSLALREPSFEALWHKAGLLHTGAVESAEQSFSA